MDTQQQARALMMRHHHAVRNRQMSVLNRSAMEIGADLEADYSGKIQGKLSNNALRAYAPSGATMS